MTIGLVPQKKFRIFFSNVENRAAMNSLLKKMIRGEVIRHAFHVNSVFYSKFHRHYFTPKMTIMDQFSK